MKTHRYALALLVVVLLAASCGSDSEPPGTAAPPTTTSSTLAATTTTAAPTTTTTTPTTTTVAPTTTTTAPTTTTVAPEPEITLALPSVTQLGAEWKQLFHIPYGDAESDLGASLGGDGDGFLVGPDYGAQGPDGSWWILDAAKRRIAHYSETGTYLGSVPMKKEHLVNGQYFQYQLPHVLDDGMLVAGRQTGEKSTSLFKVYDGVASIAHVPQAFGIKIDDGKSLYGFSGDQPVQVDPVSGQAQRVDWFKTRAGTRFDLRIRGDQITVSLPDAPSPRTLQFRLVHQGEQEEPAYAGMEAATGVDGSLYVYLYGGTDSGAGGQLGGFLNISADGDTWSLEATRDPFSTADPGSPAHLGVRPGTSNPWLMFVDHDGLKVFTKA